MNSFRTFNNNINGTENESRPQQIPTFYQQEQNTDDNGLTYLTEYTPAIAAQPVQLVAQPTVVAQPVQPVQPVLPGFQSMDKVFSFKFGQINQPAVAAQQVQPVVVAQQVQPAQPDTQQVQPSQPDTQQVQQVQPTLPIKNNGFTFGPITRHPETGQYLPAKSPCQGMTMHPSTINDIKKSMDKSRQEKQAQEDKNKMIEILYGELATIRSQIEKLTKSTDTIYEILRKF